MNTQDKIIPRTKSRFIPADQIAAETNCRATHAAAKNRAHPNAPFQTRCSSDNDACWSAALTSAPFAPEAITLEEAFEVAFERQVDLVRDTKGNLYQVRSGTNYIVNMNEAKENLYPTGSIWENKTTGTRVIVTGRLETPVASTVKIELLEEEMPRLSGDLFEGKLTRDFKRVDEHRPAER